MPVRLHHGDPVTAGGALPAGDRHGELQRGGRELGHPGFERRALGAAGDVLPDRFVGRSRDHGDGVEHGISLGRADLDPVTEGDDAVSPARRLLLYTVALVAVVVLSVAFVAHLVGRSTPSVATPAVAQDRPGTVVLVPGYGGSTGALDELAAHLRVQGRQAVVVRLPGDGTGDLRADVPAVARAVTAVLAAGAPSVDLVGYSAGGVVARLYEAGGGAAVTRRVVTLGSPHHGTSLAGLGARYLPAACPQACQQLVPSSTLLGALNAGDETPAGPQWLSLWTTVDETVRPPESARLAGAVNLPLQSVCPQATTTHSDLPRDPRVQALVTEALGPGPLRAPDTCPP